MTTTSAPVEETDFADALSERYLAYALSTIMSRSLPDVRDGLKPVHRRLLFAMRQLRLSPQEAFKKSARVVGDVMGKFHPHGDTAIYDAMVRLAQDFSQRYPLIDGQGNFGNIDGDNAAAMRYTEARLTLVAERLLQNIDEETVDFRETYDNEGNEPLVLPAAFPNLLANGAQGIAVGMATSIPPHNIGELCDALAHLIKHPNASIETLTKYIQGPDFPTGGVLVESLENIVETYKTGRGSFRVRAKWDVEKLKNGIYQIIITEIPYQVQKARLVEKLAELLENKKLNILNDIRDESAEDVRLVLEPKSRNIDPTILMESLFKQCDLEIRVSLNLNVLDSEHTPRVMSLREALQAFLTHRHDVLLRRSNYRLTKIDSRIEVLEGYLVTFLNLDDVIHIIREEDRPKDELIKRFKLTDRQAEAILNMRLRALRKLEEIELRKEFENLLSEKLDLENVVKDEKRRWKIVATEISKLKKEFQELPLLSCRRTEIGVPPSTMVIPLEATVEKEPITVICSEKGWVRAVKGHLEDTSDLKFKEGDSLFVTLHAETTDRILFLGSNGRFYTILADKLPRGRGHGEPLRLMIDLPDDGEIVSMIVYKSKQQVLLASEDGRGFLAETDDLIAQTRTGRQVINITQETRACLCVPATGDSVAVVGTNRKLLIFSISELPQLSRGKGVLLQKYRDGKLADVIVFNMNDGLSWFIKGGRKRTETNLVTWLGRRAGAGRMPPNGFPKPPRFS
ncbi:MAG: DNA topoisomerase IV subunit A [Rhodospirillaceae bacterium]|nr:DNA topoisomerase IV subunit A [Rhodospirillaceae bacterium]|tara:strand:+ start:3151 stop:5370 length:2220 start_codon:yes stop_codon:yes gene_type:complete